MRKAVIKSSLLSGVMALLFTFPVFGVLRTGSLLDIAKPHLGEYECVRAEFDGKDVLQEYVYIRLELKEDETFLLHCKEKNGESKRETGEYRYNADKGTVTMQLRSFRFFKKEFPLKKGILSVEMPIGGKNIILQFEQS